MLYVTFDLKGRYRVGVDTDDRNEALAMAHMEYDSADFGELSDIDGEPYVIEDENGNIEYLK